MEACCLRIFLVASVCSLVVEAERDDSGPPYDFGKRVAERDVDPGTETAIDLDNAADSIAETGDENFEGVSALLNAPVTNDEGRTTKGGELYELWRRFEELRKDALRTARSWSQNTYEAMKEAHQEIAKPLHYTKNALMRDAMRVNHAIRGEFKDHLAMIDTIQLDAHARNQIRSEYGQSVMIPPDEFAADLEGRRVRCNTRYRGIDFNKVHKYPLGEIIGFEQGSDAYRIRLDKAQWNEDPVKEAPTRDYYLLRKGEFALLPGRDGAEKLFDTSSVDKVNQIAKNLGESGFYQQHPYVVVDADPTSNSGSWERVGLVDSARIDSWDAALKQSRICKVVSVDKENKKFVVAHVKVNLNSSIASTPYDQREYDVRNTETMALTAGLDFHTFASVKDDRVTFNYEGPMRDVNGEKVQTKATNVEGRVISFNPAKMSYTVVVPEFEVPMQNATKKNSVQRMDKTARDWTKSGSSGPSKYDRPMVGKRVEMRQGHNWVNGTIMGFYPKPGGTPVTLKDYLYDLKADGSVEHDRGKEWQVDWRDPAAFTLANEQEFNFNVAAAADFPGNLEAAINSKFKDVGMKEYDFRTEERAFREAYDVLVLDKTGHRRRWDELKDEAAGNPGWFPLKVTIRSYKAEGMTFKAVGHHLVHGIDEVVDARTKWNKKYID